jgi:hypothetical protein
MTLEQFRELVHAEFGPGMERATPAHVHEFLTRVYREFGPQGNGEAAPIQIPPDSAKTFEQVVAGFLARVLDLPTEQAVIQLWIFACEMHYARLGEQYSQDLNELLPFDLHE